MSQWFATFGANGLPQQDASSLTEGEASAKAREARGFSRPDLEATMTRMQRANTPDLKLPEATALEFHAEWDLEPADSSKRSQ